MGQRRRAVGGETSIKAVVLRSLPAIILPLSVSVVQASWLGIGLDFLPIALVAIALGTTISAAVKNNIAALLSTAVSIVLLSSAGYLQVLHREVIRHSAVQAPGAALQVDSAPAHNDAPVPAAPPAPPVELAPTTMETLSVVLPCAFEGEYAVKTVDALRKHTRRDRLKEIIVVDDGSDPPLAPLFPQPLLRGSGNVAPVRLLRHNKSLGLIAAKKTGGDNAVGDVVVFFDCHIRPRDGWEEAFLKQMKRAGDHRTVVVPTITSLDPDTWEEHKHAPESKACYMTWSADFTWLSDPGRDVPLMSGGLLAMSRRWWQETEGYDPYMVAWGGENIDQSFRAWLCGGRIEVAEGAYVAHMWRDASNPKTHLKYKMPTEDVMRNKARAVSGWMQDFVQKPLSFPEYEQFITGKSQIGDLSNFDRLREKLNCAPFSAYIQRFSYVYLDSGLVPDKVFQIREDSTGWCLERQPRPKQPHGVLLSPCAGGAEGGVSELQLWHRGNRDRQSSGECCSGLMNWNFLQCLESNAKGQVLKTFECNIQGLAHNQILSLENVDGGSGQLLWSRGKGCVRPQRSIDAQLKEEARCLKVVIQSGDKDSNGGARNFRLQWGLQCATIEKAPGTKQGDPPEKLWRIVWRPCGDAPDEQLVRGVQKRHGIQIIFSLDGQEVCFDAASGTEPLLYLCYGDDNPNVNQEWSLRGEKLVWENGNKDVCVAKGGDNKFNFVDIRGREPILLKTCSSKVGQRLQKAEVRSDFSGETFFIKDMDSNRCLGSAGHAGGLEQALRMVECVAGQRWRILEEQTQVQHVATGYCFDANDELAPIIYPCHQPVALRKQRFHMVDAPPSVQLFGGWEDNGRKRYFDKCIDYAPEPDVEAVVDDCQAVRSKGVSWRIINPQVPIEFDLWTKAEKPNIPPLGSIALPATD